MTSADVAFKVKFDKKNDPANFELEDTTDYATLGIALADVRGNFTSVLDPLGNVIHSNTDYSTPDIAAASSLLYTGLNIPTDVNEEIIEGQYSFTYDVIIDSVITSVNTGTPSFTIPGDEVAAITAAGSIAVVRSTGNNGTYTVASAVLSSGNTVITTVGAIPSAVIDGSIQFTGQTVYTKTVTVTYDDVIPVVAIEVLTDCFCGTYTSNDQTDYTGATIISRTHTVKYPAALQKADVVSSGQSVVVTPIYTKNWTSIVETEISIDLGSGNTISANIVGSQDTVVDCDLSLCDISCCLLAMDNRYKENRTSNPTEAAKDFAKLTRMIQLVAEFRMFYECDQHDAANACLAEIKTVGNCTDACSCSDDEPSQVIPICSSAGNNVQVIAGTGMVVTTTFQNNNYVYQVGLSSSVMAIINSLKPQNVVAGTGISVAYALVSGVATWTITNTAGFTAENRMEFTTRVQFTAGNSATLTTGNVLKSGANMNSTPTVVSTTLPTAALNNNFNVSAFQLSNTSTYKVTAELMAMTQEGASYTLNSPKLFDVEILNRASGTFDFRFVSREGFPLSNQAMYDLCTDCYVNIKISQ